MAYLTQPIDFGAAPDLGPQIQQPKPGMFGAGKPKMDWAGMLQGIIGGYLAGSGRPGGNAILGMMQQRQQRKDEEAQYQRQRGEKLEDYAKMQQIQAQYGGGTNDTVADYNFWKGVLPPEQFQQYIANKVNPPRLQYVPGVGLVDASTAGSQMGAEAPQGVTFTPIDEGGPTPPASGNFLRPF